MSGIEVACDRRPDRWLCHVTVTADGEATRHEVTVRARDLERLDPGAADPEALVTASFEFLLEREAPGSILRSFELPVIARYFPDYEAAIRGRIIRGDV